MLFTLETLAAKHGDALLLHWGDTEDPKLAIIDGGPAGVYKSFLKPRLEELREERGLEAAAPLPVELLMISHIDDDHINGVLQLLRSEAGLRERRQPEQFEIATLWHNSFDDITGGVSEVLASGLREAAVAASNDTPIPAQFGKLSHCAALVVASVGQGREVRDAAKKLTIPLNEGCSPLVMTSDSQKIRDVTFEGGLTLRVIGPNRDRVKDYEDEWNKKITEMGVARAAEFADDSVFNLASIIVIAEANGKKMLLTGDARGDDIITALRDAGLLVEGKFHIDLLKMPHHGSDRNVAPEFFETVTADRYVFSGDGKHGNPEPATIDMLSKARDGSIYDLYFTYEEERLAEPYARAKSRGANLHFRPKDALSISIEL